MVWGWTRFSPLFHASSRIYFSKAGVMRPLLILSPLLGTPENTGVM